MKRLHVYNRAIILLMAFTSLSDKATIISRSLFGARTGSSSKPLITFARGFAVTHELFKNIKAMTRTLRLCGWVGFTDSGYSFFLFKRGEKIHHSANDMVF